jgi:hypothetical protein
MDGYETVEWRLRWEQFVEHLDVDPGWEWIDGEATAPDRKQVDGLRDGLKQWAADDQPLVRNVRLYRCVLTYTPTEVEA